MCKEKVKVDQEGKPAEWYPKQLHARRQKRKNNIGAYFVYRDGETKAMKMMEAKLRW